MLGTRRYHAKRYHMLYENILRGKSKGNRCIHNCLHFMKECLECNLLILYRYTQIEHCIVFIGHECHAFREIIDLPVAIGKTSMK